MHRGVLAGLIAGGVVIVVVLTVTLVLTLGNDPEPQPQLNRVVTKANQGALVGAISPQAAMFIGVPFSQPPVGEYRWKKPRDPVPYPEAYWNATYERPSCVHICNLPADDVSCPPKDLIGEDCLYLNVWAPSRLLIEVETDDVLDGKHYVIDEKYQNTDENSLAVMVFFYGGNLLVGSTSVTLYDMRFMADQGNIIGVTVNYRLGPLGFLVQGDGPDAAVGNYGIWDQIRALEWVQDNIKYFGGNPNQVTVFGQSAGAESIGVLMTSPYSRDRGLFHQCIMESNPFALPFRTWDNAREFGGRFAEAADCETHNMTCLRKIDVDTVLRACSETSRRNFTSVGVEKLFFIFQPWSPVIDGDFLPEHPVDAFEKGNAMHIPSIMGGTAHEGESYIYRTFGEAMSNAEYRAVVTAIMKQDAPAVLERFPPSCLDNGPTCDNRPRMSYLTTLYLFMCPTRHSIDPTGVDTYYYLFNQTWSFYELWDFPPCNDKVCHAAELPYVFYIGNLTIYDYNEQETVLSERMIYYWTNFAKYGNPNGDPSQSKSDVGRLGQITDGDLVDAVYWPKFNEAGNADFYALHIAGSGDFEVKNLWDDDCDFWDSLERYAEH